jgi:hypothetical protein
MGMEEELWGLESGEGWDSREGLHQHRANSTEAMV